MFPHITVRSAYFDSLRIKVEISENKSVNVHRKIIISYVELLSLLKILKCVII